MRELLNDLEGAADPVERARKGLKQPLPKRFYAEAGTAETDDGWTVTLDGRPVRTPGGAVTALPREAAARLVADEFAAQGEEIDVPSMPAYRLVNTAIDGVAREPDAVLEDVLRFASSDLLCYRAEGPEGLVRRQNEAWDPVIDWARGTLGARLNLAEGVMHVAQPREAIAAIGVHLRRLGGDPLALAAIHLMTSLTGSALLALAVAAGALDAEAAWEAAHVDEDWNVAQWGADSEAMARRAAGKRDMRAADALLKAVA